MKFKKIVALVLCVATAYLEAKKNQGTQIARFGVDQSIFTQPVKTFINGTKKPLSVRWKLEDMAFQATPGQSMYAQEPILQIGGSADIDFSKAGSYFKTLKRMPTKYTLTIEVLRIKRFPRRLGDGLDKGRMLNGEKVHLFDQNEFLKNNTFELFKDKESLIGCRLSTGPGQEG